MKSQIIIEKARPAAFITLFFILISTFNSIFATPSCSLSNRPKVKVYPILQDINRTAFDVPLIIHQAYPSSILPKVLIRLIQKFQEMSESWKRNHKHWEYILWNEKDLNHLVALEFPWLLPAYQSKTTFKERIDFAKYLILYLVCSSLTQYGGVYADIELRSLKSTFPLTTWGGLVLPLIANDPKGYRPEYDISNAFMVAESSHPFLRFILESMANAYQQREIFGGPSFLYYSIKDFELQRMQSDAAIYFLEPGYVALMDWRKEGFEPSCFRSSRLYDQAKCCNSVGGKAFAISHWASYNKF